jgi:ABC-type Mn2+/Zn2+ transport system permease subunit
MMSWLLEPLEFAFMRQALLASLLVGTTCSLLGVYVVLRRMAFLGEAIAHTTLPGIVIAYLNRWNLLVGAIVAAVLAALGIGWLSRGTRLKEDTAIGVVFSGMFALGIVLINRTKSFRDFSHMLFGDVLGVTQGDLIGIAIVCAVVCISLWILSQELMLTIRVACTTCLGRSYRHPGGRRGFDNRPDDHTCRDRVHGDTPPALDVCLGRMYCLSEQLDWVVRFVLLVRL